MTKRANRLAFNRAVTGCDAALLHRNRLIRIIRKLTQQIRQMSPPPPLDVLLKMCEDLSSYPCMSTEPIVT